MNMKVKTKGVCKFLLLGDAGSSGTGGGLAQVNDDGTFIKLIDIFRPQKYKKEFPVSLGAKIVVDKDLL